MDVDVKNRIVRDAQIKKFSAYGFLKNLAFFKPYLLIYLLSRGIDLFQIGVLYSIREIVIYLFEVPSGLFADYYGRKKELYLCFSFYIISFLLFFVTDSFALSAVAMLFFGLGEAFRSGTHKAMILSYLEKQGLREYKTFVYGRTRSFSLLGSALNSLLAIILVLALPASKYIFLVSILPYIADFILIFTYPSYLDREENLQETAQQSGKSEKERSANSDEALPANPEKVFGDSKQSKRQLFRLAVWQDVVQTFHNRPLRSVVLNQGIFQSVVKTTKDMVQPVLQAMILSSGVLFFGVSDAAMSVKIVVGVAYFFIHLLSSVVSKNVYRFKEIASDDMLLQASSLALVMVLLLIPFVISYSVISFCFVLFLILHLSSNFRKPIYVDVVDRHMDKKLRATVLSVESQITATCTIVLAPLFGYVAKSVGIEWSFGLLGLLILFMLFVDWFIRRKKVDEY